MQSEILNEFAQRVEKCVHPRTFPVAVKLLERERDLPEKVQRPKKDFGCQITPCQGWGLSRRQGLSIAMLKEDFNLDCGSVLIIFGLIRPPKWWFKGILRMDNLRRRKKQQ